MLSINPKHRPRWKFGVLRCTKCGTENPDPKENCRRRRKPVNRVGRRKKRQMAVPMELRAVYGVYHEWIKKRPCHGLGYEGHVCWGAVTGCHLYPSKRVDYANEFPGCVRFHTEQHAGNLFKLYEITMADLEHIVILYAYDYEHAKPEKVGVYR